MASYLKEIKLRNTRRTVGPNVAVVADGPESAHTVILVMAPPVSAAIQTAAVPVVPVV